MAIPDSGAPQLPNSQATTSAPLTKDTGIFKKPALPPKVKLQQEIDRLVEQLKQRDEQFNLHLKVRDEQYDRLNKLFKLLLELNLKQQTPPTAKSRS